VSEAESSTSGSYRTVHWERVLNTDNTLYYDVAGIAWLSRHCFPNSDKASFYLKGATTNPYQLSNCCRLATHLRPEQWQGKTALRPRTATLNFAHWACSSLVCYNTLRLDERSNPTVYLRSSFGLMQMILTSQVLGLASRTFSGALHLSRLLAHA
jgi:hypothetical protein